MTGSLREAVESEWPDAYSDVPSLSLDERVLAGKIVQQLLLDMIAIYDRDGYLVPDEFAPPKAYEKYGALVTHGFISAYERAIQTFERLGIVKEIKWCIYEVRIAPNGSAGSIAQREDLTPRMLGELIEDFFHFDAQHGLRHVLRSIEADFVRAGLLEVHGTQAQWTTKMVPYLQLIGDNYWDPREFFDRMAV